MFSRLMLRSGSAIAVVGRNSAARPQQATIALVKWFHTDPKDTAETERLLKRWDECNAKFYGAERDKANFPHPTMQENHPPTRLGFLPKSWFDAVHPMTGVSGPYLFAGGLALYCMSKEIMVIDHSFFELVCFWAAFTVIVKKWGGSIGGFLRDNAQKLDDKNWNVPMDKTKTAFTNHVADVDNCVAEEARHKYMFDSQRENLDLQLEARYRERVAQVHSAVKKRLDYQVEMLNTKKRLEQQHMVDWIVSNVVKGITPQQEKDAVNSCISNLKVLAKPQ